MRGGGGRMAVADAGKVAEPPKRVKVVWHHNIGALRRLDKGAPPA